MLRLSDEYDVLRHLEVESVRQELVVVDGRSLDRHVCSDSSSYHFDVTGIV